MNVRVSTEATRPPPDGKRKSPHLRSPSRLRVFRSELLEHVLRARNCKCPAFFDIELLDDAVVDQH